MADAADSAISYDMDSGERWLPVPGFEGLYEVSDHGRVRNIERLLRPSRQQRGHRLVALGSTAQRYVHRLVLEAFVGPAPQGMECRHLNGDPSDNRLTNLAWGTREENYADRDRLGEHNPPRGTRNAQTILTEDMVRKIRSDAAQGRRQWIIANEMGISPSSVSMIVNRRNWGWLDD